jgi:hypothetical protein
MRRVPRFLGTSLRAAAVLVTSLLLGAAPAGAATVAQTTTCSNGVANTGGLGLICRVTIANTFTASGGSSRVTVRECHGAAGDPTAKCLTTVRILSRPVTRVTQCNSSINGGGGTLRCSVTVVNTFVGVNPHSTAATVNQCVGSGGGKHTGCDPFPATTSGATITQCNGSANGGTLVKLTCTATGSKSAAGTVRINQCNGSANGGGALVICSASVVNRVGTTSSSGTPGSRLPDTSTLGAAEPALPAGTNPLIPIGLAAVFALSLITFVSRLGRRSVPR